MPVTHVASGFSKGLIADLDALLPPDSVLVVEDEHVAAARDVHRRVRDYSSVAGVVHAPVQDEREPAAVVRAVPKPGTVRAVVPAVEYGVVAAAALAEAWALPGAGVRAASILRDKAALRACADAAGLPQPRWRLAESAADVTAFRAAHGGRCVLKPTDRQASLGVRLLAADDDVTLAWAATTTVGEPRMRSPETPPGRFLVEERLRGPEVSVECLVDHGEVVFTSVTAKLVRPGPWPVELGHVVPAPLPSGVTARLAALMCLLVGATGFGSGVLHAEWILVDDTRPHLVECAGRLPGDSIDVLIDLAHGGSIVADLVTLLEGGRLLPRPAPAAGAAIRFLTADPGVVDSVSGVDAACAADGVREVEVSATDGTVVKELTSSWERIGHLLAVGPTGALAERRAAEAAALVRVSTV